VRHEVFSAGMLSSSSSSSFELVVCYNKIGHRAEQNVKTTRLDKSSIQRCRQGEFKNGASKSAKHCSIALAFMLLYSDGEFAIAIYGKFLINLH